VLVRRDESGSFDDPASVSRYDKHGRETLGDLWAKEVCGNGGSVASLKRHKCARQARTDAYLTHQMNSREGLIRGERIII